jgi:hypothetical protein
MKGVWWVAVLGGATAGLQLERLPPPRRPGAPARGSS